MTHLGPTLRRAKVRERPGRRAAAALVASFLLNAGIFLLLVRAGAFQLGTPRSAARVALAPVSASQWAANRAVRPPGSAERRPAEPFAMPRPPPKPPPDPEREAKGQVVDVAPSKDSAPPKNARFLAEHDSSVERESISRHKGSYERTLPTPSAPGVQGGPPPGQDGRADRAVPGIEGERSTTGAGVSRVARAPSEDGDLAGARASKSGGLFVPAPGAGAGEGGERLEGAPAELRVPRGTLARVVGGPAPDHVEDVEEGEGTFLNARFFKYATFFNRLKRAIYLEWDPWTAYDARDPDRSIFGTKDRSTWLQVTLDESGKLKDVHVAETSGLDFLDRAAITAFQKAQPFLNPPRGLIGENGEVKFAFGFNVGIGPSAPVRVFMAPQPWLPGQQILPGR